MAERPMFLVAIAGTGTEIGKTWVGARLCERLRDDGWVVAPRKPAQSFEPGDEGETDADQLGIAAGVHPIEVVPPHRWYPTPMAPPMAAAALGRPPIRMEELLEELDSSWPPLRADLGLLELAGGVASPLVDPAPGSAHGDDGVALLVATSPELVVLVADSGLGTINSIRLSVAALAAVGAPVVVLLNRFDPGTRLHELNRAHLVADGFEVLTSVEELYARVVDSLPGFCGFCGERSEACEGCDRTLEPERACHRCGRRLVVQVAPTSVSGRCRIHGG